MNKFELYLLHYDQKSFNYKMIIIERLHNLVSLENITKAELLQLKLIHLFASELLLMKKLEIKITKPTFITSVLKVDFYVVLVSSISSFFINKISLANKCLRKTNTFIFL